MKELKFNIKVRNLKILMKLNLLLTLFTVQIFSNSHSVYSVITSLYRLVLTAIVSSKIYLLVYLLHLLYNISVVMELERTTTVSCCCMGNYSHHVQQETRWWLLTIGKGQLLIYFFSIAMQVAQYHTYSMMHP